MPIPWVAMSGWWTVVPTFCAAPCRCGPPKAQSEQPVLCTRVPLRAAADRQKRGRNNRNCVHACRSVPLRTVKIAVGTTGTVYTRAAPCRRGPLKTQPEHSKLRTHPARRGYTTGTWRNTGTNHLIEQQAPDGSGPGHAIERRGYTCRWTTGFRGYPSGPLPSVRKPHAGLRGPYSDGADQTDRCELCAARSRPSLLRSAKKQSEQSLLVYIFVPVRTAELCCSVPLRIADSG